MKLWLIALCLLVVAGSVHAQTTVWQPSPPHTQIPIWPGTPPDAQPMPGPESTLTGHRLIGGKPIVGVYNVSRPTMTVYTPTGENTGVAVVVFPGGGFAGLAMNLEGTDACDWLTSIGVTCVLLKYRVPSIPYDWHCKCRPHNHALSTPSLQDAQRTIRLLRFHASKWHVNPHKIGVLGFSAGGYLVAEVSTDYNERLYKLVGPADKESARPDFALAIYPGHLAYNFDKLNSNVQPTKHTPPTFLVQAEDDHVDGVQQSLMYYIALAKAGAPAEMHLYSKGGHAFGLRPTKLPITHWPKLAATWLHTIGMISGQ